MEPYNSLNKKGAGNTAWWLLLEVFHKCYEYPVCFEPGKASYLFVLWVGTRGLLHRSMTSLPLLLNDIFKTGDSSLLPGKCTVALTLPTSLHFYMLFADSMGNIYLPMEQIDVRWHIQEWSFTVEWDPWEKGNPHTALARSCCKQAGFSAWRRSLEGSF